MQKEIYIFKGNKEYRYEGFSKKVLDLGNRLVLESRPESLSISLTEEKPPALSVIPFRKDKIAVISIKGGSTAFSSDVASAPLGGIPDGLAYIGSYKVEEAVPVAYEKSWGDGEATPGICLLTLFHQKPGIDRDTFIHRWHNGHTPLSLRLHPLWNYMRNVVLESIKEDSLWYDGIVEEQFRSRKELLNPFRFFGPPFKVPKHMLEVWRDTRSFIDMKRIETYLATEYILKSPDS